MADVMRQLWDDAAAGYAASVHDGVGVLMPLNTELSNIVAARAGDKSEVEVLDVASGSGEPACTIASHLPQAQVTCTDFAPKMVEEAKKRAAVRGLDNMKFAVADAHHLDAFQSASFDVLSCASALFALPDSKRALEEFKRVMKPNGLLLVTAWGTLEQTDMVRTLSAAKKLLLPGEDACSKPAEKGVNAHALSDPVHLANGIKDAGFTDVETREFNSVFDIPAESIDSTFFSNPMTASLVKALQKSGVPDKHEAEQRVAAALREAAREAGFMRTGGGLLFPKNLAVIAIARA